MVDYKCDRCGKSYNKKYDYNRHINRKNQCTISTQNSTQMPQFIKPKKVNKDAKFITPIHINSTKNFKCNHCDKFFSRSDALSRHIDKYCKIKLSQESQKEIIFIKLLEEMQILRKQNDLMIEKNKELTNEISVIKNKNINNGTINTNNTIDKSNNINNNTINIQLVAYGKENYDKLSDKEYQIIINKGYKSIQEMVKSLHFNKNRPENHNIYISNIRDNYVMIYEGNKWELRNRKETIEELYIAKKDILVDKFDELINKLPEYAIDKFERFINDEQDDKIKEGILEELKLILYNNKNIPLKTKERLGLLK